MRLSLVALFSLLPVIIATPVREAILAPLSSQGKVIDDSYIVVFNKDITPAQIALHMSDISSVASANVSTIGRVSGVSARSVWDVCDKLSGVGVWWVWWLRRCALLSAIERYRVLVPIVEYSPRYLQALITTGGKWPR